MSEYKFASDEEWNEITLVGARLFSAKMKWVVTTARMAMFFSLLMGTTEDSRRNGMHWVL